MQIFDFKDSTIAIKLYLVMILNLYLTSERSRSKQRRLSLILLWLCFKLNYDNINFGRLTVSVLSTTVRLTLPGLNDSK